MTGAIQDKSNDEDQTSGKARSAEDEAEMRNGERESLPSMKMNTKSKLIAKNVNQATTNI